MQEHLSVKAEAEDNACWYTLKDKFSKMMTSNRVSRHIRVLYKTKNRKEKWLIVLDTSKSQGRHTLPSSTGHPHSGSSSGSDSWREDCWLQQRQLVSMGDWQVHGCSLGSRSLFLCLPYWAKGVAEMGIINWPIHSRKLTVCVSLQNLHKYCIF